MSYLTIALSVAFGILLWGALLKGAAFLYGRTALSWLHAFQLAGLLFLAVTTARLLFAQVELALTLRLLLGLPIVLLIGTWFLQSRARDRAGTALGYARALRLSGVFFVLCVGMALLGLLLLRASGSAA